MVDTHESGRGGAPTAGVLTEFITQQEPGVVPGLDPVDHAAFVAAFGDGDQRLRAGDFLRYTLHTAVDEYQRLREPLFTTDVAPPFEMNEHGQPLFQSAAQNVDNLLRVVRGGDPETANEVSRSISRRIRGDYVFAAAETRADIGQEGTARNRVALTISRNTSRQLMDSCTDPVAIEDFIRSPLFRRFNNPYVELRLRRRIAQIQAPSVNQETDENYQSTLALTRELLAVSDKNPVAEVLDAVGDFVLDRPEDVQSIIDDFPSIAEDLSRQVILRTHALEEPTPIQQSLSRQAYEHLRNTLTGELFISTIDPDYSIEKLVETLQLIPEEQRRSQYFRDAVFAVSDHVPIERLSELAQTNPSLFNSVGAMRSVSVRLASEPAYVAQALELVRLGQDVDIVKMTASAGDAIAVYGASGNDEALALVYSSADDIATRLDDDNDHAHDTAYAELMLQLSLAARAQGNDALAEESFHLLEQCIIDPYQRVSEDVIIDTYLQFGQRRDAEEFTVRFLEGDDSQSSYLGQIIQEYVEHAELEAAIRLTHSLTQWDNPPYDTILLATRSIRRAQAQQAVTAAGVVGYPET
jgi:hypothetical protein